MSTWQSKVAETEIKVMELFKLTMSDGTIYRYTNFETDIVFSVDGQTYTAGAIASSGTQKTSDLDTGERRVSIPRHTNYLNTVKLLDRFFDNATLLVYQVAREDHSAYRVNFKGRAGEVGYNNHVVEIMFRNDLNIFYKTIPRIKYEKSCPYRTYDGDCGLAKVDYGSTGTVDAGSTAGSIIDAARTEDDDYFTFGYIELTSGTYEGEKRAISNFASGVMTLMVNFTGAPSAGDTYIAYPHCWKTLDRCDTIFGNKLNYGGFLHIPKPEESLI